MKILVTGSGGFIGKNMVAHLEKEHTIITHDIKDDTIHPEISGLDWIIHLGAISSTVETNIEWVLSNNLDYSIWLLNEAIKHKVNFQWASSASVYGPDCKDYIETIQPDPRSPYAWSKYLFERHTQQLKNIDIIIQGFRYFNVYGPMEDHKGDQASPYHKFGKQAKLYGKIKVFKGSDMFKRDFVPVETVIEHHKKFFNVIESSIWNIGTGVATSFLDVAKSFGADIEYVDMPDNIKKNYQVYTCADMNYTNNTLQKYRLL